MTNTILVEFEFHAEKECERCEGIKPCYSVQPCRGVGPSITLCGMCALTFVRAMPMYVETFRALVEDFTTCHGAFAEPGKADDETEPAECG
jgi:hypothetical protein